MAIRDELIKQVESLGGRADRVVTIQDGVREAALAMAGESEDILPLIKDSTTIEQAVYAYNSAMSTIDRNG